MVKVISDTYEEFGIEKGDDLVSINGNLINDLIDYRFHAADEELRLVVQKPDGLTAVVEYDAYEYGPLELELESDPIRRCQNKCVFCFIHQLTKGLRKSLYVKDEDYRLSFMHGNYITLTNLSEEDFQRIIDLRLSPLYISVHTTNEELRRRMLGKKKIDPLMPQINRLIRAGIELHTQVVICPGFNDGNHLIKTVANLSIFHPNLASVAIVPVGLTRHRQKLPKLKKVTPKDAKAVLKICDLLQKRYMNELGSRFLYPADEFFLMAGRRIPPKKYYEDFPQIENGVGMIRNLMSSRKLPEMRLKKIVRATVVTGMLMVDMLKDIFEEKLKDVKNFKVNVVPVENKLMGKSVTVSGLLGGRDIYSALKKSGDLGNIIFFPPNCLNDDDLFLDDWTMSMIEKKLKLPLVTGCYSAYNTFMPVLRRYI